MCGLMKKPKVQEEEKVRDALVLTRADTGSSGRMAEQRRTSKVRRDLNTAAVFHGLSIPRG